MSIVKDLTKGDLQRHLITIALPIMATSFIQMAYSFTDMAWLGRLNPESVAAVGTISVFLWIAQSLSFLGKSSAEITISHALGHQKEEEAKAYAEHNILLSFCLSLLFAVLFGLYSEDLVDLYLLKEPVRSLALDYFYISLYSFPSIFLISSLFGIYNAIGSSKIPFQILAFGLLLNIILDPLFIHVWEWGSNGAAWATLISQCLSSLYFLWRIFYKDRLFGGLLISLKGLKLEYFQRILKLGLPVAILNVLFAVVAIYMGRFASELGGYLAVATLTTGGQLEALTWNTAQGVTTALSTIVGQNYAGKHLDRVFEVFKKALRFTISVGIFGSLVFIFWGEELFALIVPNPDTYRLGAEYLRISGYSQVFMMIEITIQGLFYGLACSYIPASISIIGNYIRIPLVYLFLFLGLGLSSVWLAISMSAMIKGLVALIVSLIYKRKLRRKMNI